MIKVISKNKNRIFRKGRTREKIHGTEAKPRLVVFKSLKNIYVQLVDDEKGHTMFSISTLDKKKFGGLKSKKNKEAAQKIGQLVAQELIEKGIKQVVFDRNGYKYHGKIKLFADTARQKGLVF
ncbi:MAG: 50S ribosomal protein L18 [Deltaproteobacteria bacterium]|nr:50S ribosomal protein L18 [Deltaproteobacteria bacterium]